MNEANDKILERVRQLLAMAADSSSPHEAAIAAGRARKLMDTHQISLGDLKESNGFGFSNVDKEYRFMPAWKDILCVAVAKFNDCKAIKSHKFKSSNNSYSYQLVFQGFEADVAMAVATYNYLTTTVDRLCGRYISDLGYDKYPAKLGDAYKKGASNELCTRLNAMTDERKRDLMMIGHTPGTSLVVYKMAQVEAEFGAAKYVSKSLVSRKGSDVEAAKARGREDAKNISLNRQVGSNTSGNNLKLN